MLNRRQLTAGLCALSMPAIISRSRAANTSSVLFSQPSLSNGIGPNFSVTGQNPQYNPVGKFLLHSNQASPYRSDCRLVPVTWDAGVKTGLHCPNPRQGWQVGMWPTRNGQEVGSPSGHTTAQVCGPVVGAYLNSTDLFRGSPGLRMMIAPQYIFPHAVRPFPGLGSVIGASLDLQVPEASSVASHNACNAFVKIDFLFVDQQNGGRMSLSCGLFSNGGFPTQDGSGFDNLSNTAIADAWVAPFSKLISVQHGSTYIQARPWLGFTPFAFTVSGAQFARALAQAAPQARANHYNLSLNPADYVLNSLHLNAEMHYTSKLVATMGWSMRNLTLSQLA